MKDGDRIRIIITHKNLDNPISTPLIKIEGGKVSLLDLERYFRALEYKEIPLNEIRIEIQTTIIPRGKGRLCATKNNLARKTSVISIKNSDSICAARAIVTAMANQNKHLWDKTSLQDGFNKSRRLQELKAKELHKNAGVPENEFGSTLDDIKTFAEHLDIEINIVDANQFNNIIATVGEFKGETSNQIYILKDRNHFNVITSMPAFLYKNHYCHTCKKGF